MEKASGAPPPPPPPPSTASVRWEILRRSFLSRSSSEPDHASQKSTKNISRKAAGGFNLVPCHPLNDHLEEGLGTKLKTKDLAGSRDVYICYELPVASVPKLILIQRMEDCIELNDFEISNRYDIDTTGLVCCWPSEDVLAYFCLSHPDMFRSKRVLELGSGYGLAGLAIAASSDACEVVISDGNPQVVDSGLAIAASSDACEVVISDGNPQVVDYIQRNISLNAGAFGNTKVKSMILHWNHEPASDMLNSFDIIVASDCTFFKEFHESLACIVRSLLKCSEDSGAIFLSPKRGDSLDKFLEKIIKVGLHYELVVNYESRVWNLHQNFLKGNNTSWPNYHEDHFYPLLVKITLCKREQPCHRTL